MITKLTSEQVSVFWDAIFLGMVESNNIPSIYHQDYAIHALTKLHSGVYQAWVYYKLDDNGNKLVKAIGVTSIIDKKFHGVKVLNAEAMYGFRKLDAEDIKDAFNSLCEFGKSVGCKVFTADYSVPRVKEILEQEGFEKHRTVCRKFL